MTIKILWIIAFLLAAAFSFEHLQEAYTRNMTLLDIGQKELSGIQPSPDTKNKLAPLSEKDCRLFWQIAILHKGIEQTEQRKDNFRNLLLCSPEFIKLVVVFTKNDLSFAQQAVTVYPDKAEAWLWLGSIQEKQYPSEAVASFQKSLSFDPNNGITWCSVARLYEGEAKWQEALMHLLNVVGTTILE